MPKTPDFSLYTNLPTYHVAVPNPAPAPVGAHPRADITGAVLIKVFPGCSHADADTMARYINEACAKWGINTGERAAMFVAQMGEESDGLKTMHEYGDDDYLSYLSDRTDLGYVAGQGDGPFWAGDGAIEVTGPDNHYLVGNVLGIDAFHNPTLLRQYPYAFQSAAIYFRSCLRPTALDCNRYADVADVLGCTRAVNGGTNGLAQRQAYYNALLPWYRNAAVLASTPPTVVADLDAAHVIAHPDVPPPAPQSFPVTPPVVNHASLLDQVEAWAKPLLDPQGP